MDFASALAESMGLSDSSGADGDEQVAEAAVEYVPVASTDFDAQAAEVERRLRMASLYNAVLQESFFDGDDPLTAEVDAEFREFATRRRAALLGVAAAETRSEFSPEQVEVLTELAALGPDGVSVLVALVKMMKANAGVQAHLKAQPQRAPVPAKVKPPAAPTLRKHKVAAARPEVRRQTAPAPAKPPQPVAAPAKPPATKPAAPVIAKRPPGDTSIPPDGAVYKDGGETYLAKHVEITPEEYGPQVAEALVALAPGQSMKSPTGTLVFRDREGVLKKLVPSRRSGQRRSSKAGIPFPADPGQFAGIVAGHAGQVAANAESGALGGVINAVRS